MRVRAASGFGTPLAFSLKKKQADKTKKNFPWGRRSERERERERERFYLQKSPVRLSAASAFHPSPRSPVASSPARTFDGCRGWTSRMRPSPTAVNSPSCTVLYVTCKRKLSTTRNTESVIHTLGENTNYHSLHQQGVILKKISTFRKCKRHEHRPMCQSLPASFIAHKKMLWSWARFFDRTNNLAKGKQKHF